MFGKRGSALEAVVGAPIDPDPTAHGRPWAMERASHPCVRLSGAGERHANELPLRLAASPLACNQYSSPSPRSRSVGRSPPSKSGGMRRSAAKMGRPLPLPSTPLLHFCPLISHLQLLLSCWPVFRPACCLLAAALRGETLKPLHCPAPSLPPFPACTTLLSPLNSLRLLLSPYSSIAAAAATVGGQRATCVTPACFDRSAAIEQPQIDRDRLLSLLRPLVYTTTKCRTAAAVAGVP